MRASTLTKNRNEKKRITARNQLTKKIGRFIGIVFADVLFLFSWGFAVQPLLDRMVTSLSIIIQSAGRQDIQSSLLQYLLENPVLRKELSYLLIFAMLAFAGTYFFYCTFQGAAWHLARLQKANFAKYSSFFFSINIRLAGIFLLYHALTLWRNVRIAVMRYTYYKDPVWWVSLLFLLAMAYFASISYVAGKPLKKSLSYAVKRWKSYAPFLAAIIFAAVLIGRGTEYLELPYWLGGLLLFPLFAWGRMKLWRI